MTTTLTRPTKSQAPAVEDPFFYGWRYVEEKQPGGDVMVKQVPLTEEDVLHPQEYDFIMQTGLHNRIAAYLRIALKAKHAHRKEVVVIGDTRVEWGKHGLAHGPDVAMFSGVKGPWSEKAGTFRVAKTKGKARLVIEATSPSTRGNDFGPKLREYFRVGIPVYVIIDLPEEEESGGILLYGYQAGATQYEPLAPDKKGRLWLDVAGVWLGVDGDMVYLEDADGKRLPEYEELVGQLETLSKARDDAEAKAAAEAKAREAAEAKVRELEARLARRHNGKQ
jgi:colicin import membrane protein